MSRFRLAHLSDPHLQPPPFRSGWRDVATKRTLSRIAWRRKRHRHRPEVLAAIAADVKAQAPDHVVVTGDLTNFSTPEEFAAAGDWLKVLGDASAVTVSPGNHDALLATGAADPFAAWRPWLGDDPRGAFPQVRIRDSVALVNLCSAVPTALHLAQGRLGQPQIERLGEVLRSLGADGLFRVVLIHHPVTSGAVSGRKSLTDGPELRRVLQAHGAELVLHGHAHEALVSRTPGPNGPIPVLGVPSASSTGEHDPPARWHGFEIERLPGGGFDTGVVVRGLGGQGEIEELGRYRLTA